MSSEMTGYSNILVEREENIGIIFLNRPKVVNAISSAMMKEILSALNDFEHDEKIGCMVITGSDRAFASGADIKEMANQSSVDALKEGNLERFDQIQKISKPIIAAISGYALGGGLELAMACDIIIAAEGSKLGQTEVNIGVFPGGGGTQRITKTMGKYFAMDMILTGRLISANEALQHGLVSRVVPNDSYLSEAKKLAKEIASKAPLAVRFAKDCIVKSYETTLPEGLDYEHKNFYLLMSSEDKQEGMKAFMEKRAPVFKGK